MGNKELKEEENKKSEGNNFKYINLMIEQLEKRYFLKIYKEGNGTSVFYNIKGSNRRIRIRGTAGTSLNDLYPESKSCKEGDLFLGGINIKEDKDKEDKDKLENGTYYLGIMKDGNIKKWSKGMKWEEVVASIKEELGLDTMKEQLNKLVKAGCKQIIFTGAPGTGKTFTAKEYAKGHGKKLAGKDYGFVQFHSSYDYTDFVEGIRPVSIDKEKPAEMGFVKLDGIFKGYCRKIVEKELQELWEKNHPKKENFSNCSSEEKKELFEEYKKTDNRNNGENYFFIIDEINRADLSRVFGELMYCLEEGYRGVENHIDTQYQNLKTYKVNEEGIADPMGFDCFEDGFFIPENLVILGTMNDIDRSVETFDFALRRRFQWIPVKANIELCDGLKGMGIEDDNIETAEECIKAMNDIISNHAVGKKSYKELSYLNESYHIGHAYFKGFNGTKESMETIFENRIRPLLREYCRGALDETRIREFCEECKSKLTEGLV